MENKVIILGVNHQSTLGFVRCFGEAGIKPICIIYGSKEGLVFSSKYPSVKHYEETAEQCLNYIITHYSGLSPKPFLFGSNDTSASVINENYNKLKKYFLTESAKDTEGEVVRLMNKWQIYNMAEQYGLNVAKTLLLEKGNAIPSDIEFPVFVKSMRTIDGGKVDEEICRNHEELTTFMQQCHSPQIMIQKFIDKKLEFNYYGYCSKGVHIPYENHRPRSIAGALSGYHVFVPANNNNLYRKVKSMMEATGYNGLFTAEFLVDKNGKYWFMEINFRHDGATYLLMPGINLPMEYCKTVLGFSHGEPKIKSKKIIGIREQTDYNQSVKKGNMSITKWLKDFITADSRILVNLHDFGPCWYIIKRKLLTSCANES